jgi:RNA polymerase sigma-70 factor (ECF subfamily)
MVIEKPLARAHVPESDMAPPTHETRDPLVPPSSATSRSLLERVRVDDPGAWEQLIQLYAPLVFHWCRRWDLQSQDMADIFQEVFQAVARHISTFRKANEGDTFRGWLRTITHNKVRDLFRKLEHEPRGTGGTDAQRQWGEVPAPEESSGAEEEAAEASLFRRALERIQGEFEERTWRAFWRTAVDGQSAREVAADLAMTPGAVRVAKFRVLHRLREELGEGAE